MGIEFYPKLLRLTETRCCPPLCEPIVANNKSRLVLDLCGKRNYQESDFWHPRHDVAQWDHNNSSGRTVIITCRISIARFSGAPSGPGAAEALAAISNARCGLRAD